MWTSPIEHVEEGSAPPLHSQMQYGSDQTDDESSTSPQSLLLLARNRELSRQIESLQAERRVLLDRQQNVMDLISASSPDQLLHDLRNVLNERELFRVLAFPDDK